MFEIENYLTPEELQLLKAQQKTPNTNIQTNNMFSVENYLTPEELAVFNNNAVQQTPTFLQGMSNIWRDLSTGVSDAWNNREEIGNSLVQSAKDNFGTQEGRSQIPNAAARGLMQGFGDFAPGVVAFGADVVNSYYGYDKLNIPEEYRHPVRSYLENFDERYPGAFSTDKAKFAEGLTQFAIPAAGMAKGANAIKTATKFNKLAKAQKASALEKAARMESKLNETQKAKYARQLDKIKSDYKTPEQLLAEAEKNKSLGRRVVDETVFGAATGATEGENLQERATNFAVGGPLGAGGTLLHAGFSKGLKTKPVASALNKTKDATNKFIDNHEGLAKGIGFVDNALNLNSAQGKAKQYSELYKKASEESRFERLANLSEKEILALADKLSPEEYNEAVDILKKGISKKIEEQRVENIKAKARRQRAKKEKGKAIYEQQPEQQVENTDLAQPEQQTDNTSFVQQILGEKKSKEAEEMLAKKEAFKKLNEKRKEMYADEVEQKAEEQPKPTQKTKQEQEKETSDFWDKMFDKNIEKLNELAYGSKTDNINASSEKSLLKSELYGDNYKQRYKGTAEERTTVLEPESREFNPEKSVNRITNKNEDLTPDEVNVGLEENSLKDIKFIDQATGKRVGAVEPNSGKLKDEFKLIRRRHDGSYLVRRRTKEELQKLKENKEDRDSIQEELDYYEERKNWKDYQRQELIKRVKEQNEEHYNNDVEDAVENVNKEYVGHGFHEETFEPNGQRFSDKVINDEMTPKEQARGVRFMHFVEKMENAKDNMQQKLYDDFYDSLEKQSDKDWFVNAFQEHTFDNVNKNRIRTRNVENETKYNKAKKLESDFIESSPSRKERSNEIEFGDDDFKAYTKRSVENALEAFRMFLNEQSQIKNNSKSKSWDEDFKQRYKDAENALKVSPKQAKEVLTRAFEAYTNKQELYDTIYNNLEKEYNKTAIRAIVRELNEVARGYGVKVKGSGRLINNQTKYAKAFDVLEKAIKLNNAKGARKVFRLFDNKLHKKYGLSAKQRETIHEAYSLITSRFLEDLNKDKAKFTDTTIPIWERDRLRKKYIKEYENLKRIIKNSLTDWEQREMRSFNEEGILEGTGDVFNRQQSGVKEQPYVKIMSEIESILYEHNPKLSKYKVKNTQQYKVNDLEQDIKVKQSEISEIDAKVKTLDANIAKVKKEIQQMGNLYKHFKRKKQKEKKLKALDDDKNLLLDKKHSLEADIRAIRSEIDDFNLGKDDIDYNVLERDLQDLKNGKITKDVLEQLKAYTHKRRTYAQHLNDKPKTIITHDGRVVTTQKPRFKTKEDFLKDQRETDFITEAEYRRFEKVFKKQQKGEKLTEKDLEVIEQYQSAAEHFVFDGFENEIARMKAKHGLEKYKTNKAEQHSYQMANDYYNGKPMDKLTSSVKEGTHLDFLDGLGTYTNSASAVIEAINNFVNESGHVGKETLPEVLQGLKNIKTTFKPLQLLRDVVDAEPPKQNYTNMSELPVSEKLKIMFSYADMADAVFAIAENVDAYVNGQTLYSTATKQSGVYLVYKNGEIASGHIVRTTAHELGHNFLRKHPEYIDLFGLSPDDMKQAADANKAYNDFMETADGKKYIESKKKTADELKNLPEDEKTKLREIWEKVNKLANKVKSTNEETAVSNFAEEVVDFLNKNYENKHTKKQKENNYYERATQYEEQFSDKINSRIANDRGSREDGSSVRNNGRVDETQKTIKEFNEINDSFDDFIEKQSNKKEYKIPAGLKTFTDYIDTVSKTSEGLLLEYDLATPKMLKDALKKFGGGEDAVYFKQYWFDNVSDYTKSKTGLLGEKKTTGKSAHGNAKTTVIANAQRMIDLQHADTVVKYLKKNFSDNINSKDIPDGYIPVNSKVVFAALAFKKSKKWFDTVSKGTDAVKRTFSGDDSKELIEFLKRAGTNDMYMSKKALDAVLDGSGEDLATYYRQYVKGKGVDARYLARLGGLFLDFTNHQFKKAVLATGSFFTNNRIGNQIMLMSKADRPTDYFKGLYNALRAKDNVPSEIMTSLLLEACENMGKKRKWTGWPEVDNLLNLMDGHFLQGKGTGIFNACIGIPNKAYTALVKKTMKLNEVFERFERKQAYFQELSKAQRDGILKTGSKALTIEEMLKHIDDNPNLKEYIITKVNDILGDYNNFSNVEKKVFKRIIPFYSWHRTIMRHTFKLAKENPTRFGLIALKLYLLNNREDGRPDWQRGVLDHILGLKLKDGYVVNKKRVFPHMTVASYVDMMKGKEDPIEVINPALKTSYEALVLGRKTFKPSSEITHKNWKRVTKDGKEGYFNKKTGEFKEGTPWQVRAGYLGKGLLQTVYPHLANPVLQGVSPVNFEPDKGFATARYFKKGKLPDKMYDASLGSYYDKDYIGRFEGKAKYRGAKMALPLEYQLSNRLLGTGIQKDRKEDEKLKRQQEKYKKKRKKK